MDKHWARFWLFTIVYLSLAIGLLYLFRSWNAPPPPKEVTYSEFISELRAGHLSKVNISEDHLRGELKEDAANARSLRAG